MPCEPGPHRQLSSAFELQKRKSGYEGANNGATRATRPPDVAGDIDALVVESERDEVEIGLEPLPAALVDEDAQLSQTRHPRRYKNCRRTTPGTWRSRNTQPGYYYHLAQERARHANKARPERQPSKLGFHGAHGTAHPDNPLTASCSQHGAALQR